MAAPTSEIAAFYDVYADCEAAGIVLHRRLVTAGHAEQGRNMHNFAGVPLMSAFIGLGRLLRWPSTRLAFHPDGAVQLTSSYAPGSLADAMKQAINSSLVPVNGIPNIRTNSAGDIPSCSQAEGHFMRVARDMQAGPLASKADIFVEENGTPLLVRKPHGASSSLSLAPLALNGVVLPPFSIFRVEAAGDIWLRSDNVEHYRPGVHTRPMSDITAIRLERPSAFSVPAGDLRKMHFDHVNFDTLGIMGYDEQALVTQVAAVAQVAR